MATDIIIWLAHANLGLLIKYPDWGQFSGRFATQYLQKYTEIYYASLQY